MASFPAVETRAAIAALFEAQGVPFEDARLVSAELVRAEQMGIHSHGLIRTVQYVNDIKSGRVRPGANVTVLSSDGPVSVIDCGFNLGIVAAHQATTHLLSTAARHRLGVIVTRRCNHVGRLGSYVERCARQGFVAIAAVAIPRIGHFVVPWGGIEGRLGTNPLAFGFPCDTEPIVADFATSVIPEGRIRAAMMNEERLPPNAVLDARGNMTIDPAKFYGPPRGSLLPVGGPAAHKGYALALLAELLGGALAGGVVDDDARPVNGLFLLALDPSAFALPLPITELGQRVVEYMHSSPPAADHGEVLVPGEPEFQRLAAAEANGTVEVDEGVWEQVAALASDSGVEIPEASAEPHVRR